MIKVQPLLISGMVDGSRTSQFTVLSD